MQDPEVIKYGQRWDLYFNPGRVKEIEVEEEDEEN